MLTNCLAQVTTEPTTAAAAAAAVANGSLPTSTVDQVLAPYVYVFFAAFLVSFAFVPVMRQVALYYNIIDQPDGARKLHKAPVAYLGGVAVFLGWLAGLAISQFIEPHRHGTHHTHLVWPWQIVVAALMIVGLGLYDDIRHARPLYKILVQAAAASVLLSGGIGSHCLEPVLSPVLSRLQRFTGWNPAVYDTAITLASGLFTIALVVGSCNATNLMDGLDGLCGGVSGIVAFGFVFLAVHMATYGSVESTITEGIRISLGLALLGGVLGFVPFNFNPASIFMGDTGSMFIGFSFATLMAMMAEERPKWFLASMVMFALPVMDTALAFARRFINKRPIFSADRHHIHHQLVNRGFTVKQTVVISYGLTICFAVLGGIIVFMRTRYAVAVYIVVFGYIIVAAYKMGMVHEKVRTVGVARRLTDEGGDAGGASVMVGPRSPDDEPFGSGAVLEVST